MAGWWHTANSYQFHIMQHVKHSAIVCLWNQAWIAKAHLGSQLPIMILCYVLKLDDPPLYKWGSTLVLVVRRKRVELLIELLGGDYGTHSGIIAPLLGTLFSQSTISRVKTQFLVYSLANRSLLISNPHVQRTILLQFYMSLIKPWTCRPPACKLCGFPMVTLHFCLQHLRSTA